VIVKTALSGVEDTCAMAMQITKRRRSCTTRRHFDVAMCYAESMTTFVT